MNIYIHIFNYPVSQLSGLHSPVFLGPDNQGSAVLVFIMPMQVMNISDKQN